MSERAWQVGDVVCLMEGDEEIERREVVDRYLCWKDGPTWWTMGKTLPGKLDLASANGRRRLRLKFAVVDMVVISLGDHGIAAEQTWLESEGWELWKGPEQR